jgi:importin-5
VAAVAGEPHAETRRKLGHVLAQVAAALPSDANWPELLQLTAQLMAAADAGHREAGFELLDKVAEYSAALLLPFASQLPAALASGLGDATSPAVRLAALKAACSVVLELARHPEEAAKSMGAFKPLIAPMLRALEAAVKEEGQEEAAQAAIGALSRVTEDVPKFWGDAVGSSVGPLLAAIIGAGGGAVDCAVRVAAIDWAATLAEKAPARVRRGEWMANALLPALLNLICVPPPPLEDAAGGEDAWAQRPDSTESMGDLHDGEEEEEDLAEAAALAFDRLAKALGAKAFYKAAAPRLLAALQDQDPAQGWCRRRGALYALAMMTEGCEDALHGSLPQLLPFLLRFVADPHPRVRYALLVCLRQLCEDLPEGPDGRPFQKVYASQVLPALATALSSEPNRAYPRILAAAASAVASFCHTERLSAKMVGAPALEALLRALFHLLTAAPLFVREEAMTAVATLAQVVGEAFVPYYDTFVPLAKQILAEATAAEPQPKGAGAGDGGGGELSMLGLKALEAFALMGDAVGRDKFRADAHEVLRLIAGLHERRGSGLLAAPGPASEAQAAYIMNSTARIGTALGPEFAPYLAQVLPMVLEAAARKPTYRVRTAEDGGEAAVVDAGGNRAAGSGDGEEEEAREGDQLIGVEVRGGGRFEVMVNSWEIQQREVACQSLVLYVEELGSCLATFLPAIFQVVLDLITPTSTPDVRICAYHMLPKLLRCAARASSGMGAELASEALNEGVRRLVAGLAKESEMVDSGSEDTLEVLCAGADTLSLGLEVAYNSARASLHRWMDGWMVGGCVGWGKGQRGARSGLPSPQDTHCPACLLIA